MEKIYKYLLIIILLTFSVVINQPVSFTEDAPKTINKIYFKDGSVIKCDMAWEGMESQIICKKSGDLLPYSAGEVDLEKTFGKTDGKEIAERYERMKRERELMSEPIVTPEDEREMKRQRLEIERKMASELKALKITQEIIDLEKRALRKRSQWKKIRELERDPAVYFTNKGKEKEEYYKKEIKRMDQKTQRMEQETQRMEQEIIKLDNKIRNIKRYNDCYKNCIKKGKSPSYCERKCSRYNRW